VFSKDQQGDHGFMLEQMKKFQEADHDNREKVREAQLFLNKRDGQWEPRWANINDQAEKPRFTFDMVTPIIDQIAGEIERSDFTIKVSPAGSEATKKIAETYDGLVRHIETMSGAVRIYNAATKRMAVGGMDGWRVVQKYADADAFDQDLMIEKIGNFVDRVWFGAFEQPDASDATECWVLTGIDKEVYKEKYPKASGESVSTDSTANAYYHRQDLVMLGEFLYVKEVPRELILMSSGEVYEDDEEFAKVKDDLERLGVTEVQRRTRKKRVVCTRLFDSDGWVGEAKETVFSYIPVVPEFVNFDIIEDKIVYWGAVEKVIDAQRVFNYSLSREIEEGALAPRAKTWGTPEQRQGHEDTIATLNTNTNPWQDYNHVDGQSPPFQVGGAQINPGLRTISETSRAIIGQSAGMFAANMGDNPNLQSGIAIKRLQDKGDNGNSKYTVAREIAQAHTGKILVDAIPRVYTPGRQVRILDEDGSFDMVTLGDQVVDNETGQMVALNDLSQGNYDVAITSGPSFKNRQSEAVEALTNLGQVDPSVIHMAGDLLMRNISAPGMEAVAGRKRAELLQQGLIPPDQWTDEEKQQAEQAQANAQNQPPQEDPMVIAARAEELKGQADMIEAQTKMQIAQAGIQQKQTELEIKMHEAETKRLETQIKQIQAESDRAKIVGEIKSMGAKAAKDLAEAEAQDIENDSVVTGVANIMKGMGNGT
jgi:hypothetical protein